MINTSGNTLIIDIRDELSFEYGHIDGAVNIPAEKLDKSDLPKDKNLLICCKSGLISDTEAEKLRELGYDAENLEGGYYGWLREKLSKEVVKWKENLNPTSALSAVYKRNSARRYGTDSHNL